jgi:hypothetical protein
MKNKYKEELFKEFVEIDNKIWSTINFIQKKKGCESNTEIMKLMELRGQLHNDCMRPIYKEFPELADTYFTNNE